MSLQMKSSSKLLLDENLRTLLQRILHAVSTEEKLKCLKEALSDNKFLQDEKWDRVFGACTGAERLIYYSLLAIDQTQFFHKLSPTELEKVVQPLLAVEQFYKEIGGIIGYHAMCLRLLDAQDVEGGRYHPPNAFDISEPNLFVTKCVAAGIERLDELAELYPIGGAADRLSLQNEKTGEFQIAATLLFCGKTLLERMIQDLQAREYLHFKLFGRQVHVPVGLMTSNEKRGDHHVREMLKKHRFFGKRDEDFFVFSQPLVPAMNTMGRWCTAKSGGPLLKPGGHGVIWKLARDCGLLNWYKEKSKRKVFVRQINNPIAGVDYGLLAFMGRGLGEDKDFGFASCPRREGVSEGVNVVIEKKGKFSLTNIEYCDRKLSQLNEEKKPFLANTNLLFVDIAVIEELVEICPIPGMLVNAKKVKTKEIQGVAVVEEILRLESMMQNLADALQEDEKVSRSFITSNSRKKTISTIKKEFAFGSSMMHTPEQCYLDMLENSRELLTKYCGFQVPELHNSASFFENGPSFIFLYHPALGPLYELIKKKLVKGRLARGSELYLEIADFFAENLDLDGSLYVSTEAVMGHRDSKGVLRYSNQTGKCVLKNVRIRNSGINRDASRSFWKQEIVHKEKCEILIEEGGEFYAEDLILRGSLRIHVPSGVKVTARVVEGQLKFDQEVLEGPSWGWNYSLDSKKQIQLNKE